MSASVFSSADAPASAAVARARTRAHGARAAARPRGHGARRRGHQRKARHCGERCARRPCYSTRATMARPGRVAHEGSGIDHRGARLAPNAARADAQPSGGGWVAVGRGEGVGSPAQAQPPTLRPTLVHSRSAPRARRLVSQHAAGAAATDARARGRVLAPGRPAGAPGGLRAREAAGGSRRSAVMDAEDADRPRGRARRRTDTAGAFYRRESMYGRPQH